MTRKARHQILFDGCYAHVFSRAIDKRKIFNEKEDFKKFINLLAEIKNRGACLIHHYSIMITHFHLVVSLPIVDDFSMGMHWVKWQYTHYYNLKYKRYGPLWRERFKSMLIENEAYLTACGRYVESNPVKAGLVARCEDWDYSSSRFYFQGRKDPLIEQSGFTQKLMKEKIDINDDSFFTKGDGIGSEWFRFCLRRRISDSYLSPKR